MPTDLSLDISAVPFSRFGSYMAISQLDEARAKRGGVSAGIWLRCVHGDAHYEVMRIDLVENGTPVECQTYATASTLTLQGPAAGRVDICITETDTVRFRVTGAALRITATTFRNHCAIPEPGGSWVFNMANAFRFYRLVPLAGQFMVDAPWEVKRCKHMIAELTPDDSVGELAIEQFTWTQDAYEHGESFDELARRIDDAFEAFCEPYLDCPEHLRASATFGAWVNWSSVVHAHRLLKRPTMYMSKNWMTNVWSWDHAFNAWATCLTDADLAWDQLMVMFDHQHENGQIPDFTNDVRYLTCFVKPPVHGWILTRMIECLGELPKDRLEEGYTKLGRWTDWWFKHRDPDGDGLPVYWHGNDSGWDNGTVFDVPLPLKAADLSAFLIVQMDALATFAEQLGRADEAQAWRDRADTTFATLIDKLWDGSKFQCISTVTRQPADPSDSVFNCLPIILGQRLLPDMRDALVVQIKHHLTEWGPATEHPDSPMYEPDGYWRGPIWAPSTIILIDGLRMCGQADLARDIAERFCRLCDQGGFAENFDAVTGAPLRDLGYTWTSSVFLVLANRYL